MMLQEFGVASPILAAAGSSDWHLVLEDNI
jgi:hypothetical protein